MLYGQLVSESQAVHMVFRQHFQNTTRRGDTIPNWEEQRELRFCECFEKVNNVLPRLKNLNPLKLRPTSMDHREQYSTPLGKLSFAAYCSI